MPLASRQPGGLRYLGASFRRRTAAWGFAAALSGAALAVGAVHTTVLCVVAFTLSGLFLLRSWDTLPIPARSPAKVVVAVGIVLVVWTFLQQVDVPTSLLALVAPANADVWERSLTPLRESGPTRAPLSLDPVGTRVSLLRAVVMMLAFLCALQIAGRTAGAKFLERAILASSLLVALAALAHPLLGIERVFGVWKPESVDFGARIAPLLNTNHLAAYLTLGMCNALAWALSRRSRTNRLVPFAFFLFLACVQLVIASRGGVATALLGCVLVILLGRRRQGDRAPMAWTSVAAGIAILGVVGALVLRLSRASVAELTSADTVKLRLIRDAMRTLEPFGWMGMGRGAFESVFPAFRADGEGNIAFTHPENVILQWVVEWGAVVAVPCLIALMISLRPRSALSRPNAPIGAAAGLIAVAAHNLLDFSAEIPAVGIALAASAACVVGGRSGEETQVLAPAWWTRRPRWTAGAAVSITGAAIVLAAGGIGRELRHDGARLRAMAMDPGTSRETFVVAVREAMLRHPAEPYLPLMGAVRAARARDESPIPWLARTLERASVYGRAHLLLARQLHRRSPGQARLEYRLAIEQDYNLFETALGEGAGLVVTGDDAMQLIPKGRLRERALELLGKRLEATRPEAATRLFDELARHHPASPAVTERAARRALQALRDDPACTSSRGRCIADAMTAAETNRAAAPARCASHRLVAEVQAEAGDPAGAFGSLDRALDGVTDRAPCARFLVELAQRAHDDGRVSIALERVLGSGCADDGVCVETYLFVASVEEARSNPRRALSYARRAADLAPERNDVLAVVARLHSASGDHASAVTVYRTLVAREPGSAAYAAALAEAEASVAASQRRVLGIDGLPR